MAFRSWLTSSLVRVYPATPPARVSLPSLEAARNEAFSFQLALRSDTATPVAVEARGPAG